MQDTIDTIFGSFSSESKKRLDLTFDYETSAIRSFKRVAEKLRASHVIDVGANIGVYSVYLADIPSVTEIHAFEPAPETHKLLRKNVALQQNAAGKIRTHAVALSSQEGEVNFNIVSPLSGANGIVGNAGSTTTVVRAARLDDYLDVRNKVACIKVDVEGHEISTISGSKDFLKRNKCYVQVESLRPQLVNGLNEIMRECSYQRIISLQNDHLFLHKDLSDSSHDILDIISGELANDLRDLTTLRLEKRKFAHDAKLLWQSAGYRHDPILVRK